MNPFNELYKIYSGALIYIAVSDDKGNNQIGTGFHVGEGLFVTARHVVENMKIVELATTAHSELISAENKMSERDIKIVEAKKLRICEGPYFHPNNNVDVAIFKVNNYDCQMPIISLSSDTKTSMDERKYILNNVLILGYPPIPFTTYPALISTKAEINAMIALRNSEYNHFIVSSLARGGFSGGPVLTEDGMLLGIVTESLMRNEVPSELGYMNIITVDAVSSCINTYFKLDAETNGWAYCRKYMRVYHFSPKCIFELNPNRYISTISIFDSDPDIIIELTNIEPTLLELTYEAINELMPCDVVDELSDSKNKGLVPKRYESPEAIIRAVRVGVEIMKSHGYILITDVR